jgi:hypothetical protein
MLQLIKRLGGGKLKRNLGLWWWVGIYGWGEVG